MVWTDLAQFSLLQKNEQIMSNDQIPDLFLNNVISLWINDREQINLTIIGKKNSKKKKFWKSVLESFAPCFNL